jgi:hypothetical protein
VTSSGLKAAFTIYEKVSSDTALAANSCSSKCGYIPNFPIGSGLYRLDRSDARTCGRTVDPHRTDTQRFRGDDIVIKTLANVQDLVVLNSDPLKSQVEYLQAGLITTRLLSGDDMIEIYAQFTGGSGKQIVIDIGDDCQLEPGFQAS